MAISVKEIEYKEYGKCVEISNGTVDVVVTVDVGRELYDLALSAVRTSYVKLLEHLNP